MDGILMANDTVSTEIRDRYISIFVRAILNQSGQRADGKERGKFPED